MRIEPAFLRSAVARRVFWVLLAAAGLPLAVFAAIAYATLTAQNDWHSRQRLQDAAKYSGLRVYDRLVTAQGALAAMAAGSAFAITPVDSAPLAARDLLRTVATVDLHDGRERGDVELVGLWHRLVADADDDAGLGARRLWWQRADRGRDARVIVAVRDAGRWWLAEVSPAYLWSELRDTANAAEQTCVRDTRGAMLLCAGSAHEPKSRAASWGLFLGGHFAAPDWQFTRQAEALPQVPGEMPLEQIALLAGIATLLLVGMLSLVLVRRSTAPLELLIDGTRRLARQDWSARVEVAAADEYAQLAQSFNQMAERIGGQVQAMQVQSTIDREILSGIDLPRVMQLLLSRIAALAPSSRPAVLLAPAAPGRRGWRCHRPGEAQPDELMLDAATVALLDGDATAGSVDTIRQLCAARGAEGEPPPTEGTALAARWNDRLLGVMLLAWPSGAGPTDEARLALADLRDRLTVALAAATREAELRDRAVSDSLTGLLNRAGLVERLDELLADGDAAPLELLYIDLDGFKEVNDALGHPAGDELLCQVAALLREEAPDALLAARPGGDEFVVGTRAGKAAAEALAQRLCRRIESPWTLGRQQVRIGASVGLVHFPDHGRNRVELLRRADMAMYAAKSAGRGRHAWFDPALDERAVERAWLQRELRAVLDVMTTPWAARAGPRDAGRLLLHYQPRLRCAGDAPVSLEALVRWQHPERGLIGPMQFVPLAEETGLVEPLGRWVLSEACRQLRQWRDAGVAVARVAVNVSELQLRHGGFAAEVLAGLQRHGLRGSDLEIELTESLFIADAADAAAKLQPLREAGVRIALDDFGTGFSSLSQLYRLPVDVLKIDRGFVVDLGHNEAAAAVARSIVALARALGKQVVAEGVETEAQESLLRSLGCDELQGYRFAKPLAPQALEAWVVATEAVAL